MKHIVNDIKLIIVLIVSIIMIRIADSYLEKISFCCYPVRGLASWYDPATTVFAESARDDLTCAMRRKDFGRLYKVCNIDNQRCIVVKHDDWGPRKSLFDQGRIVDLSKRAFAQLADLDTGLIRVRIETVR